MRVLFKNKTKQRLLQNPMKQQQKGKTKLKQMLKMFSKTCVATVL